MKQLRSTLRLAIRMRSSKLLLSSLLIAYANIISYYRCKAYSIKVYDAICEQRNKYKLLEEYEKANVT